MSETDVGRYCSYLAAGIFLYGAHLIVQNHTREKITTLIKQPSPRTVYWDWFTKGISLVSEFEAMSIFMSEKNSLILGILLILARLGHILCSLTYINHIIFPHDRKKATDIDIETFKEHRCIYNFLIFIATLEVSLLVYLPWNHTRFADKYEGFPNLTLMKSIQFTLCGQAFVGMVCAIVWLSFSIFHAKSHEVAFVIMTSIMSAYTLIAAVIGVLSIVKLTPTQVEEMLDLEMQKQKEEGTDTCTRDKDGENVNTTTVTNSMWRSGS